MVYLYCMDRKKQEKFIQQLIAGEWETCLTEKNFQAVSDWLIEQTEPEVFIRFEFHDSKEGAYAIHLGCQLTGNLPQITRLLVPNNSDVVLDTPNSIGDAPIFNMPHHPIWRDDI